MKKYILDGKVPVPCDDVLSWGKEYEKQDRKVAQNKIGDANISTVFLALDHNWGEGPPILFETMVFGGKHDQYQERYSTWEEAEAGHAKALKMVKEGNHDRKEDTV